MVSTPAQQPVVVTPAPDASKKPPPTPAPAPAPPAGARATQPSDSTGKITGRVVGEGGEPLTGVTVYANGRSTGTRSAAAQSDTTDDEGQFVIENLALNVYAINASLPGYVVEPEAPLPPSTPSRNRARVGDNVTVRMLKGGVITGTVTDAAGDPLVGLSVRVIKVRELEGSGAGQLVQSFSARDETTDDRGVYRAYGLASGVYVVAAGGSPTFAWWPVPFGDSAPTFYPSGTRDTAAEVTVRAGQETAGVDIRFRDDRGQRVTGTVTLPPSQAVEDNSSINVNLLHAASGTYVGTSWSSAREVERTFSFEGLADGDYDVTAQHSTRNGLSSFSPPLRVNVRGADVTGLKLTLIPYASLSGTLFIEPLPEAERAAGQCKDRKARTVPQETGIYARFDPQRAPKNQPPARTFGSEATPDEGGAFNIRSLQAGRYRIQVRPADENFYAHSVLLPETAPPSASAAKPGTPRTAATASAAASAATPRDSLELRPGQQLSGVNVRVAEGAASFGGRVVPAEDGGQIPSQTRVYLLPAEREHADNTLRFYEATPSSDGVFAFRNLAPGRYWLVARVVQVDPSDPTTMRPVYWDAAERTKMRREAEAANVPLDLKACQRVTDFTLRYPR